MRENDPYISRNKNNILPKIQINRTADKKLSKSNNHTLEKFNSLQFRLEECKKKLFRNNSNWSKRHSEFNSYLKNSKPNIRYLK